MTENRSECVVINARDIEAGPVCRILLPHRISSGTHATWAARPISLDSGRMTQPAHEPTP
jgi:carotenoid cleavage dioxygenase-like enzyme